MAEEVVSVVDIASAGVVVDTPPIALGSMFSQTLEMLGLKTAQ